ncbi:MAG: hypothetical protein WA082_05040 [Candidatus Moraniibacteriota bacterium]
MGKIHNLGKALSDLIPFELKRGSSFISVITALILVGFFGEIGKWLFEKLSMITPLFQALLAWSSSVKFELTLTGLFFYLVALIVLLFPIYRYVDRALMKSAKGEIVFFDDFKSMNRGWSLNYWGTTNPQKNSRIEGSMMIFEASENEVLHERKEFGAYIDLRNGIYAGYTYEISCIVKSDPGTNMGFQLWVHDTRGGKDEVSKREPAMLTTPSTQYQELKLQYVANSTNALRIHLHNRAGVGKIYVDKVVVSKL